MEHRLAAILSADAAGYTRLLAEDQASTIRVLAEARAAFGSSIVRRTRGRSALDPQCGGPEPEVCAADRDAGRVGGDRRVSAALGRAGGSSFGAHMHLAAIHAQLGGLKQARAALAEVLRLRPDFSIAKIPRLPSGRDFLVENLRKAGLPE
jgi:hypothetical protein